MDNNILISHLKELGKNSYDGPEGIYNEYSLTEELVNHLNGRPTISIELWDQYYELWRKYIKEKLYFERSYNTELELFLEKMELIYDFSKLVFK